MNKLASIFCSLFGVGYIRPFSASWGSLASGLILYWVWPTTSFEIKLVIMLLILLMGSWLSGLIEKKQQLHDPHFIVIDELLGMMITCFFLPQVWWQWLLGFFLFRLFDIAKLWPASIFDEQPGGFSIMIDDAIMAIPSLLLLELVLHFLG